MELNKFYAIGGVVLTVGLGIVAMKRHFTNAYLEQAKKDAEEGVVSIPTQVLVQAYKKQLKM